MWINDWRVVRDAQFYRGRTRGGVIARYNREPQPHEVPKGAHVQRARSDGTSFWWWDRWSQWMGGVLTVVQHKN